jgi:hypothetical protein
MTLLQTVGFVLIFIGLIGLGAAGLWLLGLWCAINIDEHFWRRKE